MDRLTNPWGSLLPLPLLMACLAQSATAGDFPPVSELRPNSELPDPLTMFDGRPVTNREQWVTERRPELIRLFQHYMYGELPAAPKTIETAIERVDANYFGGKAKKKEVTISFGPPGVPKIHYLVADKDLDKSRIAVVGHSRLGKTALLAGALDERIALVIPHQAGCGGTAPSRHVVGEQVRQINDRFPHWFCDEFKKFNDQVER